MSKTTVNFSLKNKEELYYKEKIKGILNNKVLLFNDDNIMTTITIDKTLKVERKCDQYKLFFTLDSKHDTICAYHINGSYIDIPIETIDLVIKDNYIYAKYKMDSELIELEISYEVI